jgi:hypothetical protein
VLPAAGSGCARRCHLVSAAWLPDVARHYPEKSIYIFVRVPFHQEALCQARILRLQGSALAFFGWFFEPACSASIIVAWATTFLTLDPIA